LALTTLQRVYSHAARRQGYAGTSPVAALEQSERPSGEPKVRVILTPEQVGAVLAAATPKWRPMLAFMAGTGCRIGETLGLTWGDLDLSKGTATITAQLSREGARVPLKTRKSRRTLDLPGSLVQALREHKIASAHTADDALVFATRRGTPLDHRNVARHGLVAACKAAGVPVVSPHAMRHAHASALLADGMDLAAVSRRLGHASVAITAGVYSHVIDDARRRDERRTQLDGLYGADDGNRGNGVATPPASAGFTAPAAAEAADDAVATEVADLQLERERRAS
jgi:integrase